MEFFSSAIDVLSKVVIAIGAGMAVIGIIHYLGAQNSNDAAGKNTGTNMIMAGGGIALVGVILVPQLKSVFGMISIPLPPISTNPEFISITLSMYANEVLKLAKEVFAV